MRFLKHAGVAAGDVVNPDTARFALAPTKQRILISLDVGLVVALAVGCPEQHKIPVERGLSADSSSRRTDRRSAPGSARSARGRRQTTIQIRTKQPHPDLVSQYLESMSDQIGAQVLGLAKALVKAANTRRSNRIDRSWCRTEVKLWIRWLANRQALNGAFDVGRVDQGNQGYFFPCAL